MTLVVFGLLEEMCGFDGGRQYNSNSELEISDDKDEIHLFKLYWEFV